MAGLPSQGGGGPRSPRHVKIKDQPVDVKIKDQPIDVKIKDQPIDVKIKDQPIDVNVLNAINADITDRCSRLLGQLCFGGVAIDPRDRNWTLDFVTDQVDISGSTVTVNTLTQFVPIEKAVIHNSALPAANTNILGADITPTNSPTTFRIMVSISIAAKFNARITRTATTTTTIFNGGANLVAGALFIFDLLVHSGDSINFQFSSTGGTINELRIQEIDSATA